MLQLLYQIIKIQEFLREYSWVSRSFGEHYREERNDWKLDLQVGEGPDAVELEIFGEQNPPKRVNRPEACGLRHLAFRWRVWRRRSGSWKPLAFPANQSGQMNTHRRR